MHCLTASSKPCHATGTDITSVLQMGKLSHREVRGIAQGQAAKSYFKSGSLPISKPLLLPLTLKNIKSEECGVVFPWEMLSSLSPCYGIFKTKSKVNVRYQGPLLR